ncbi:MAG TPA: hypothetical protein VK177_14590 [Flavobacteriales bacterium]|nr:hypothetical protein [Flavobacteriales bacterium]
MEENATAATAQKDHKCNTCAAILHFTPGTSMLTCQYCGAQNEIVVDGAAVIEEHDFKEYIAKMKSTSEEHKVNLVKCDACGAETTFNDKIVSDNCNFCGSQITVKSGSTCSIVKPKSILPFKIDSKQSFGEFQKWIKGLWWAPGDLAKYANNPDKLSGIYIPYWTYDSETDSDYTGQRGDNYTTTETYTAFEDGKSVTRTRTVTKIRWSYASGALSHAFDDVLVLASTSLPRDYTEKLEPWDLENLVPFDEKYLSGFRAEAYKVDLAEGFQRATVIMDAVIRTKVKKQIGGDHQTITSLNTQHNAITFKHTLLPVYLSTFKYNNKAYRFMINGRTGEVQGERPYSTMKIVMFILMCLAIIGGIIFAIIYFNNK